MLPLLQSDDLFDNYYRGTQKKNATPPFWCDVSWNSCFSLRGVQKKNATPTFWCSIWAEIPVLAFGVCKKKRNTYILMQKSKKKVKKVTDRLVFPSWFRFLLYRSRKSKKSNISPAPPCKILKKAAAEFRRHTFILVLYIR